jgi:rhamnose utilization protein RhaD (predicted bifunctional aldolase and dehydrogenase)
MECAEVARLRELSACLGRNPLLVQASTGNTSIKVEGTLWMKASGKWFAHADQDDFFIDLDVSEIQQGLREASTFQSLYSRPSSKLARGSIETTMHATLPFPVVVHVHSLNTLAWAVRADGEAQLAMRLNGLSWQWLPYVPSGLPLALEIERVFSRHPGTNVFVLSNHGLVVCGGLIREGISRAELEMLVGLAEVVQRIAPEAPLSYLSDSQVEHVLSKEASQYLQLAHANSRTCSAGSGS